jgi:choline dehydrogenase
VTSRGRAAPDDDGGWDFIIVGAGSAGCVLADRLSADGCHRVLVLEAGREDRSLYIHIPAGAKRLSTRYDWRYPGEPDPTRGGVRDTWAAGRVVGGSSSINGMIWVRGHPADFDGWAAAGCAGWDYLSVLPYFERAETYHGPTHERRGDSGPVSVAPVRCHHPITDTFVRAAQEAGLEWNADYNGPDQEGVATVQLSQRRGWRHSTARAYLARARRRSNVTVRTGSWVQRIVVEEGHATGVEYHHQGRVRHARCRGEVILAAGAIASPKLLLLSGIGPADHLGEVGVEVVRDLPGVGRDLQEHLYTTMLHSVTVRTLNRELTPWGVARHGLDFLVRGRGPATSGPVHALAFVSGPSTTGTEVEILYAPFGILGARYDDASDAERPAALHDIHNMRLLPTSSVTTIPCVLHPHARGTITLRSNRPDDQPVIRFPLLSDEEDVAALIRGCDTIRKIFATPAFSPYVTREEIPGPDVRTAAEWQDHLRTHAWRGDHPVGTCRMGNDADAVVDPHLRVRGIGRLRVVDASIMPSITSGNTNAPTVMIAERASDLILAAARSGR